MLDRIQKTAIGVVFGCAVVIMPLASNAELTVYEGFDYTVGTNLNQNAGGGTGWKSWEYGGKPVAWYGSPTGYNTPGNVPVAAGSLTNDAFPFTPAGNRAHLNGNVNAWRKLNMALNPTNQAVYFSFLIRVENGSQNNAVTFAKDGAYQNAYVGINLHNGELKLWGHAGGGGGSVIGTAGLSSNTTYMIVGKLHATSSYPYGILSASIYSLDAPPSTEPVTWGLRTYGKPADPTFLNDLDTVRLSSAAGNSTYVDELRMGTTWDSVVVPVPEHNTVALFAITKN